MKYLLSIALFIVTLNPVFSQDSETGVPFVSYWSKGDSYDFKISKIKQKWKSGEQTKNDTTTYNATFTVLDSTATSYKISWTYDTEINQYLNDYEGLSETLEKYEDLEIIYTTSEVGEFIEIENWEEVSEMMGELFTEVIKAVTDENDVDEETLITMLAPFFEMYKTQQGIEYLVFNEIQLIHFPFGVEFMVAETLEYDDLLPNMLGGDPVKGKTKLYIDDVDFDEAECTLIQEMALDPKDTRDMILDFFKKLGIKDKEMKKLLKSAKIEVNDFNTYQFYYYPGVPIYIEAKRETVVDIAGSTGKGIDITIIELL